jgi:AraC-like DNA-binding protein
MPSKYFFEGSVRGGAKEMHLALPSENLQRVGFLSHLPGLLRRFGVNPTDVLLASGLSEDALDNPEGTIAYRAMGVLAETACKSTRCPHFGLEIGRQIQTATLGLLGQLMRNSLTLRDSLHDFALNQHRNAHGGVAYLLEDGPQAFLGYAVYQPDVPGNYLICDAAAMGAFTIFRELASFGHPSGLEVLFARSEPSNIAYYRQAFGVKLTFNADQTAIAFPRRMLEQPIHGADTKHRIALERSVRDLWHAGDTDLSIQLRRELRVALIRGDASAIKAATHMGMNRRTMHRRLDELGLKFQKVLDETRCEYAQQLLAYTRLEINKIATMVGYTDPSVFTRGFVRWTDDTPSHWRAKRSEENRACI